MTVAASQIDLFRTEVRNWLELNCPASMRTAGTPEELVRGGSQQKYANPESKLWLERMVERGWTVPEWPQRYGGAGLNTEQNRVLRDELNRINARTPLQSLDTIMIGPLLLECGTEFQKNTFLPRIARGEILWCQGYSEPGAGSDLAGLSTFAHQEGDEFVVNGAKIWTSYAHYADWMFCLVRTDKRAPKHQGISFLLIDMMSPGITTSPINLISGHSPFCEVHFDAVRVPTKHLVGELNKGWGLAKRLLELERAMISGIGEDELGGDALRLDRHARRFVVGSDNAMEDSVVRSRIARQQINDEAFRLLTRWAKEANAEATMASPLKYLGTELNKLRLELAVQIAGTKGLVWDETETQDATASLPQDWLRSKANSIEGGSSEIQLNVIAKQILGLPS